MTTDHQNWLLDRFDGMRAAVIGDAILDRFVDCAPSKLCTEGPVPVVWRRGEVTTPGGAANVAANLSALGASVAFVSATGSDDAGLQLRAALAELGVGDDLVVGDPDCRTHTKTRILADGQYVVRVDEGRTAVPDRLLDAVDAALAGADVLVLSDYGLGVLHDGLVRFIAERRPALPIVVDAKRPARFRGLRPTAVTPNLDEATALAGTAGSHEELARRVREATAAGIVALTLGDLGAYLLDGDGPGELIPARPTAAASVASVVGAGDSFAAALALGLAAGAGAQQAATVAVEAAGIAVAKRCTAVVTAAELARSLDLAGAGDPARLTDSGLLAVLERRRRRGERIVFTNGVFDLLHPGHVDFLRQARRQGDVLVVAVNSDASVRRLKGPCRPVLDERGRLSLVAALDCVDHALCFDDDTAAPLMRSIRPDVYVKGGDYANADLPEAETAHQLGARVVILPRSLAASTTSLIRLVRDMPADDAPAAEG